MDREGVRAAGVGVRDLRHHPPEDGVILRDAFQQVVPLGVDFDLHHGSDHGIAVEVEVVDGMPGHGEREAGAPGNALNAEIDLNRRQVFVDIEGPAALWAPDDLGVAVDVDHGIRRCDHGRAEIGLERPLVRTACHLL